MNSCCSRPLWHRHLTPTKNVDLGAIVSLLVPRCSDKSFFKTVPKCLPFFNYRPDEWHTTQTNSNELFFTWAVSYYFLWLQPTGLHLILQWNVRQRFPRNPRNVMSTNEGEFVRFPWKMNAVHWSFRGVTWSAL